MLNIKKKSKKGAALYLALIIISVLLAIGTGLNTIIINQLKILKGVGDSVVAIYAADTGVEVALYSLYTKNPTNCSGSTPPFTCSGVVGSASYSVIVNNANTSQCPSESYFYYCIKSVGEYNQTKRAIEAGY